MMSTVIAQHHPRHAVRPRHGYRWMVSVWRDLLSDVAQGWSKVWEAL